MERRIRIRAEARDDRSAVHAVNAAAFGGGAEAGLVDVLREQAYPIVSLVAELGGEVVGHILFSPVTLGGRPDLKIMGLAPMAVTPAHQRSGIGSALVEAGLERCSELDFGAVVVLGHRDYYPRFGFISAARFGLCSEYDAPDDTFMTLELRPDYLRGVTGIVRYHPAFGDL